MSLNRKNKKEVTPWRAARKHYGPYHWHAEVRTSVIVCRQCRAKIAKFRKPECCPECGAGKELH